MRVGVVQHRSYESKEMTVKRTLELIDESVEDGAKLILLQELHQDRYFCINESIDSFSLADSYEDDLEFWSNVAKERSIVLVTSLFEKRAKGLYHNSAVVFDSDGTIAGKYRKMHIPDDPGFYEKFYFAPGDLGFEPIDTTIGRLGVLICWDQWFSEAARIMALKGADILIYPTAIGWFDEDSSSEKLKQLDAWITVQRAHAISNNLPLIAINRVGKEFDDLNIIDGIRFWGNSFAVDPQGVFLYRGSDDKEESVVIEVDMDRVEEVRRVWPFFRDRRIDSYSEIGELFIGKCVKS